MEQDGQSLSRANWSTDIDRRTRLSVRVASREEHAGHSHPLHGAYRGVHGNAIRAGWSEGVLGDVVSSFAVRHGGCCCSA
jgi:hypothetical protein